MFFLLLAVVLVTNVSVQSSEQDIRYQNVIFKTFSTQGEQLDACRDSVVIQKRIKLPIALDSTYQIYGKLTKVLYLKIAHFLKPGSIEWITLCFGMPLNKKLAENLVLQSASFLRQSVYGAVSNDHDIATFFKNMHNVVYKHCNQKLIISCCSALIKKLFLTKARPDATGCLWWNPFLCLLIDEPHMVSEIVAQGAEVTSPSRGMAFLYTGFYFLRYNNKKVYSFPSAVESKLPVSLQRALFLKRLAPCLRCCLLSGPIWCCMMPSTTYILFMLYTIFSNLA